MRSFLYAIGGAAMAALVWIALFGSTGHLADPAAAWGSLIGVFLGMQVKKHRMQSLRTAHVIGCSLSGALVTALVGRAIWRFDLADWPAEIGEAVMASLFVTVLMAASFHCLTLGRGHMP